jgi:hypothetical protein
MADSERPTVDELLELQGENRPESFDGQRSGPGDSITRREAAERRVFLARLLMGQYQSDEIYAAMAKQFGMDTTAVDRLELEVYRLWETEDTKRSTYWKHAARRRILDHIRAAGKAGNWPSVMAGEKILAGIEGTNAPIEIRAHARVEHSHAVLNLIGQLSEQEVLALAEGERARETQRDGADIEVVPADPDPARS